MIPVTLPFLPPQNEYEAKISGIWKRNWLTNNGPLVQELETKLKEHLRVDKLLYVTNGTIALQLAIKALNLTGEIITTPFTYVASTSSIAWENCKPVFVDIDKETYNIDPEKIEQSITYKTSAILATHVYGNPCDVDAIQKIANKYNLKVIYDAAHAFGVKINNKSIFEFGDISTCSLHATKIFHSIEGGLVITKNKEILDKLLYMRNFGHDGYYKFAGVGINGKNSEFHAAMGLVNLNYVNKVHEQRKLLSNKYDKNLMVLNLSRPKWHSNSNSNYCYYPIVFKDEKQLLKCMDALNEKDIFPRRYFYPSLSSILPYVKVQKLCIADNASKRILCLPLYYDLTINDVNFISNLIIETNNSIKR